MSSDSEEDFLSADEGSDYDMPDIPKKSTVADDISVKSNKPIVAAFETIDQSTAGKAEEIDSVTENINVKVSFFDEDIIEPPSLSNDTVSNTTLMKDPQQKVVPPSLSNKNIESISSSLDAIKIVNSEQSLPDSSKSKVSMPKKSVESLDASSRKLPTSKLADGRNEITPGNDSQPCLGKTIDEPETKIPQDRLEGSLDTEHDEPEHVDLKSSNCNNSIKDTDITKSSVASFNVSTGDTLIEKTHTNLTDDENSCSVDQTQVQSEQNATENKLKSVEIISKELSSTDSIPKQQLTTGNIDLHPAATLSNEQFPENIHDQHNPEPVSDSNSKPDPFITKPRKTSKIGLKKPREKLGERIGVKKLGSKVNKPLESISCDSVQPQVKDEKKEDQTTQHYAPEVGERKKDVHNVASKNYEKVESEGSWGSAWGSWGTTLLSAASTLTQEVGRGVGSVVELVEEGIGAPSPEELAKEQRERERILELEVPDAWQENWSQSDEESTSKKKSLISSNSGATESSTTSGGSVSSSSDKACAPATGSNIPAAAAAGGAFSGLGLAGFGSLVSGVSGALETAGSKVMLGGLDTLELIGRRTMDVLQESDPNLRSRKDRLLQSVNKPNLAVVLREAREKAVANPVPGSDDSPVSPTSGLSSRVTFAGLWDNSTGPAHLEALALIARQCSTNSRTLQSSLPPARRREADQAIKEIMELSEIDEENLTESSIFSERVTATIRELGLPLNADNIAQCWSDLSSISEQYSEGSSSLCEDVLDGRTVQSNVVGSCVLLVERLVAVAHKAAELCLTTPHDEIEPTHLATQYRELVVLGGSQLESCADAVCTGLSSTPQQEKLTPIITNIYMQVCEGSSCLQQSLVHLCTTLQLVQLQRIADPLT